MGSNRRSMIDNRPGDGRQVDTLYAKACDGEKSLALAFSKTSEE